MIKYLWVLTILVLLIVSPSFGAVLFSDNFDSWTDWASPVQTTGETNCPSDSNQNSTECALGGGWTGWRNGDCQCTPSMTGWPGNRLEYINQYAGYPNETNTCYGGSGKCYTHWMESCTGADDSDGQLTKYLGDGNEYEEVYMQFQIRFKSGCELETLVGDDSIVHKLQHIQHYVDGNPHTYFGGNMGNLPVISCGLGQWSTSVYFYCETRCYTDYYCNAIQRWTIGTTTTVYNAGNLLDTNWHRVEWRFRRNSAIGVDDGLIQMWMDAVQLTCSSDNCTTLGMNDTGTPELRGFRWLNIGGNNNNYYEQASSNIADREQWYAIDNVCVSTSYIGTGACTAGAAPATPTGITIIYD